MEKNIRIYGVVTIVTILYYVQLPRIESSIASDVMQCLERLMPCQPYIHSVDTPPQWCCDPMKEIVEKNTTCLCTAFDHPELFRLIELTKDNALNLLRSCGANYDASICTNNTSGGESSSSSTRSNAAIAIISLLGFSFIYAYIGF